MHGTHRAIDEPHFGPEVGGEHDPGSNTHIDLRTEVVGTSPNRFALLKAKATALPET